MYCDKHEGLPPEQRCGRLAGHEEPCRPGVLLPGSEPWWSEFRSLDSAAQERAEQAGALELVALVKRTTRLGDARRETARVAELAKAYANAKSVSLNLTPSDQIQARIIQLLEVAFADGYTAGKGDY
jgi:hypothetical protein